MRRVGFCSTSVLIDLAKAKRRWTEKKIIADAEVAVGNLIAGCDSRFTFEVRKAAPQSHESAGYAERAVRTVKESLKTLMLDHESVFILFPGFRHCDYPQDCEACPDASLFTVGSMDAPCWLLYHGPIVTVNSFQRVDRPGESQEAMDGKKKRLDFVWD